VASEDLETVLRWVGAGGTWELVRVGDGWVELDLLTCGGDEVMGRVRSREPDLRQYVDHDPADAEPRPPSRGTPT
jgi:hypothetical protein